MPLVNMTSTDILNKRRFQELAAQDLVNSGKEFFIIWNPQSDKPPRVPFADEAHAWQAAEEMAQRNPRQRFYVLRILGHAVTTTPVVRVKSLEAVPPKLLKSGAPSRRGVPKKIK